MMDATKYHVGYYPPPVEPGHVYEWPQKDHIEKAPAWCSVDLRDGNQSLIVPMNLEEKLEFYDMLIRKSGEDSTMLVLLLCSSFFDGNSG